jgi:hypothetical protein
VSSLIRTNSTLGADYLASVAALASCLFNAEFVPFPCYRFKAAHLLAAAAACAFIFFNKTLLGTDKVAFLREGLLLEHDTPDTLMRRYNSENLEQAFVQATQAKLED